MTSNEISDNHTFNITYIQILIINNLTNLIIIFVHDLQIK